MLSPSQPQHMKYLCYQDYIISTFTSNNGSTVAVIVVQLYLLIVDQQRQHNH